MLRYVCGPAIRIGQAISQIHTGTLCTGPARRLAEFDGGNVTLSSAYGGSSVNPSVTPPLSTLSNGPSSIPTPPIGSLPTSSPPPLVSSVGGPPPDGTPQPTQPLADEPVTITIVSTVFLNPTNPAASLPTQSPAGVVSSSSVTVPGIPASSVPPSPSSNGVNSIPSLFQPSGISSSASQPQPSIFTTLIPLGDTNVPSSSTVSSSIDQPSPTPSGIIFLPPA